MKIPSRNEGNIKRFSVKNKEFNIRTPILREILMFLQKENDLLTWMPTNRKNKIKTMTFNRTLVS